MLDVSKKNETSTLAEEKGGRENAEQNDIADSRKQGETQKGNDRAEKT